MLINGRPKDRIDAADRGLLYGDGLFETVRIRHGEPLLWSRHIARLQRGCRVLGLTLDRDAVDRDSRHMLEKLRRDGHGEAVLKIMLTRGSGGRGYHPPPSPRNTRIVQLHPLPRGYDDTARDGVDVMLCRQRLSENRQLAGLKHLNRLDQVLASGELTEDVAEGLMCDQRGAIVEGTRSNLFLAGEQGLITPALEYCGVAGIMREWLLERCGREGIPVDVRPVEPASLALAPEVFLCNSVFGVWPVRSMTGPEQSPEWPIGPLTRRVQQWLSEALDLCSTVDS